VTFIPHHQPELIIREGRREVERIPLGNVDEPGEFVRLMEAKGFERTAEFEEEMENRRTIEFVAAQEADIYFVGGEGEKNHIGTVTEDGPIAVEAHVGDVFEAIDGFGDTIKSFRVVRRNAGRHRYFVPGETPPQDDEL
jgi:hypothetical protein